MDSVAEQLFVGRSLRALLVVDGSAAGRVIEVAHRLRAEHVVAVLNRLVAQRGRPLLAAIQ